MTTRRYNVLLTGLRRAVPAFAFALSFLSATSSSAQTQSTTTGQPSTSTPKPTTPDAPAYAAASDYSVDKKSVLKFEYAESKSTTTAGFFQINGGAPTTDSQLNIVATSASGIIPTKLEVVILFKFSDTDTISADITNISWDAKAKHYPLTPILKDLATKLVDEINKTSGTEFGAGHPVPKGGEATIKVTPSIPTAVGAVPFFAAQEIAIKPVPFSLKKATTSKIAPFAAPDPAPADAQQAQPKVTVKKEDPANPPAEDSAKPPEKAAQPAPKKQ